MTIGPGLRRLSDIEITLLCASDLGVLVVTRTGTGRSAVYQADIERLRLQGQFDGVLMGKLVIDAPTAPEFMRENPWLDNLTSFPTTVLYQHGQQIERLATSRAADLLRRIAALTDPQL